MPNLFFLRPLFSGLAETALRFPLPLCMALLFCAMRIADRHDWLPGAIDDRSDRLLALAVLGFFWTLSARLFAEGRGWGNIRQAVLALAGLGLLAIKIFADQPVLHDESETVLFLGPAMILLAMAAPFLARGTDSDAFWDFNRTAWLGAALAFLAALILASGLMFAIWAIEELFGWRISWRIEGDIWILAFALFCPWLALARVPRRFDAPDGAICPRALSVLIAYVLVPLAIGYAVIVYAYLVRILVLWELPQGQVGVIVSGYAGFGIATYLATWPLRQDGPVHVRLFHRYFHYALALPIGLLAAAVAERVSTYGVTEPRYALGVFAAWLAVMTGAFIWRRGLRLTMLPLTLAILLAATSFGPWGAADISLRSQTARLASLLGEAGLFANGRVLASPDGDAVAPSQRREVVSIVRYLGETGRLATLAGWFEDGGLSPDAKPDDVLAAISENVAWDDRNEVPSMRFTYSAAATQPVTGYDLLLPIWGLSSTGGSQYEVTGPGGTRLHWSYRHADDVIRIQVGDEEEIAFDLVALVERMRDRYGDTWDEEAVADDMVLVGRVGPIEVRIPVFYLDGYARDGVTTVWQAQFALLLRAAESPGPPSDDPG